MSQPVTITKIHIACTSGANQRPISGDVFFSDGKSYGWMILPTGTIEFFTHRKSSRLASIFPFQSAKRAAALLAKLEG